MAIGFLVTSLTKAVCPALGSPGGSKHLPFTNDGSHCAQSALRSCAPEVLLLLLPFGFFSPKLSFCKNKTISKKNTLNRLRKPLPVLIGFVVVSLKNDHYTVVSSTANMKALRVACLSNTGAKVRKCVFELAKRHSVKVDLGKSKYSFT